MQLYGNEKNSNADKDTDDNSLCYLVMSKAVGECFAFIFRVSLQSGSRSLLSFRPELQHLLHLRSYSKTVPPFEAGGVSLFSFKADWCITASLWTSSLSQAWISHLMYICTQYGFQAQWQMTNEDLRQLVPFLLTVSTQQKACEPRSQQLQIPIHDFPLAISPLWWITSEMDGGGLEPFTSGMCSGREFQRQEEKLDSIADEAAHFKEMRGWF